VSYTLIFISYFVYGAAVLTQAGFPSKDTCESAGREMVKRAQTYDPDVKIEWVCK
jgi:hypothetical protein